MVVYKGRKKYSQADAEIQIDNIRQQLLTLQECIATWRRQITEGKTDRLIEGLCHKSTDEMIQDAQEQEGQLKSKLQYIRQFAPDFKSKLG